MPVDVGFGDADQKLVVLGVADERLAVPGLVQHVGDELGRPAQHLVGGHRAIALSEGKYCSVSATLRGKAKITTEYQILV